MRQFALVIWHLLNTDVKGKPLSFLKSAIVLSLLDRGPLQVASEILDGVRLARVAVVSIQPERLVSELNRGLVELVVQLFWITNSVFVDERNGMRPVVKEEQLLKHQIVGLGVVIVSKQHVVVMQRQSLKTSRVEVYTRPVKLTVYGLFLLLIPVLAVPLLVVLVDHFHHLEEHVTCVVEDGV